MTDEFPQSKKLGPAKMSSGYCPNCFLSSTWNGFVCSACNAVKAGTTPPKGYRPEPAIKGDPAFVWQRPRKRSAIGKVLNAVTKIFGR